MNASALIERLASFPSVVAPLVSPLDADDARWRPDETSWSIVEIIAHLADEEVLDFRARVERTLSDPTAAWDPIDPERRAIEADYRSMSLRDVLARFTEERARSIGWLCGLDDPDWSATHTHPKFGSMRAGDLFAAWAAHDLLHLRQIGKRLFQMLQRDAGEYGVGYAGQL